MGSRKFIALFLLIILAGRVAIAEDTNTSVFTYVKVGEAAKFAGYLFSPEAIAKVYSTCKSDLEQKELECTADINSRNIDLDRLKEIHISEISIKNKLIEDISKLKEEETVSKEKLIKEIELERDRNKLFIAGAFLGGILITGTIMYFTAGIVK